MGRKIPGKKHHGVKDPFKQQAKRESELKLVINAPPKNIDDQDIPKSLERVIKLKNAVKSGVLVQKKRKKKRGCKLITLGAEQTLKRHPKAKPEKVVPIFNQRCDETQHQFWQRVNRETENFLKEAQFENKYGVDVKRNTETGCIEGIVKKPKSDLEEIEKLKSKAKNINKKKKKVEGENTVKLSKSQKRKEKLRKKEEKKLEDDIDEFKVFKDKVEFGDVAHAPPELKTLPKNVRKVKYNDLLLNALLKKDISSKKENIKASDRTGKRKDLPAGERRQLEKQQSEVIAAYRQMKAKQHSASSLHI
ncbi:coiled-coil domain-containing protein 137 [Phymastichus coffea]|uniref:coiled-coil domain-containing protein 137 n=1 Tax=Phymastichus coffea TaxID=108790 RepID=UPI00273CEE4D|nr:coiled-coil domain-containing protein 137 [Phymastichus coffea]